MFINLQLIDTAIFKHDMQILNIKVLKIFVEILNDKTSFYNKDPKYQYKF